MSDQKVREDGIIELDTQDVDHWIGKPLGGGIMKDPIQANDIRRWAQGMQNPNPLYYDEAYAASSVFAQKEEFKTLRAPQSFAVCTDTSHGAGPAIQGVIPGAGAVYRLNSEWRLLAGVHRGFNPPAPGSSAEEESSINFEAGVRYDDDRFKFESIYFLNDYDNLVGTVTDSTGGGGQIGGGETGGGQAGGGRGGGGQTGGGAPKS